MGKGHITFITCASFPDSGHQSLTIITNNDVMSYFTFLIIGKTVSILIYQTEISPDIFTRKNCEDPVILNSVTV